MHIRHDNPNCRLVVPQHRSHVASDGLAHVVASFQCFLMVRLKGVTTGG